MHGAKGRAVFWLEDDDIGAALRELPGAISRSNVVRKLDDPDSRQWRSFRHAMLRLRSVAHLCRGQDARGCADHGPNAVLSDPDIEKNPRVTVAAVLDLVNDTAALH